MYPHDAASNDDDISEADARSTAEYFGYQYESGASCSSHAAALQANGWNAFDVFAAGASGPRCFATLGFDVHLLSLLRSGHLTGSKWLLGGSTAALRFCAILSSSLMPERACLTLELRDHFMNMAYEQGDSPETLAPMMAAMYGKVLPEALTDQVVSHPSVHLAIMVAQILPPFDSLPDWQLKAMFWMFLGANFVTSKALSCFQKRLCFYTGSHPPPFISCEDNVTCVPLTRSNIYQVLAATTCLPFISPHCRFIDGLGHGLFFDGALVNYHLNLRPGSSHRLLLMADGPGPQFKQTLWDSYVPFRCAPSEYRRRVSIVYPTQAFADAQPAGKLPDTFDFFDKQYIKAPELRRAHWQSVYNMSVAHFPRHPAHLLPANAEVGRAIDTRRRHDGGKAGWLGRSRALDMDYRVNHVDARGMDVCDNDQGYAEAGVGRVDVWDAEMGYKQTRSSLMACHATVKSGSSRGWGISLPVGNALHACWE